jgi:hypothetical protein
MRTGIGIAIVVAIGLIWSVAVIAPRFPNPLPPPASPRGARPTGIFVTTVTAKSLLRSEDGTLTWRGFTRAWLPFEKTGG